MDSSRILVALQEQARWRERFSADRMCLETMRYFEDVLSASGAG